MAGVERAAAPEQLAGNLGADELRTRAASSVTTRAKSVVHVGLRDSREFRPIPRQPGDASHLSRIQCCNQKYIVRDVPLARDPEWPGRFEPESRIERRVPQDDDERAAGVCELAIALGDQSAADPAPLMLRKYRHRTESGSSEPVNFDRAVQNVADDTIVVHRHERQRRPVVQSKRVDETRFEILAERARVDVADRGDVGGTLGSNLDQSATSASRTCRTLASSAGPVKGFSRRFTFAGRTLGRSPFQYPGRNARRL